MNFRSKKLDDIFYLEAHHTAFRRLLYAAASVFILILVGATGYYFLENWNFLDSLYMTIITLATVGFEEVHQLSDTGRIFTIVLIVGAISIGGYALGTIVAFLTEGQVFKLLRGRKMAKEVTNLNHHIIVCGYGKIGRKICRHLYQSGETLIVIDKDPERIDEAIQLDYLAAVGDASEDDILIKAGIKRAKYLVSAISNDTANVYLVLSARTLNDRLEIIARSSGESSTTKLLRAGASQVVSPFEMGARRMATYIIQPEIIEFEDMFSVEKQYGLQLQKLKVQASSSLVKKQLNESAVKEKTKGGLIIGIERQGHMQINPPGDIVIQSGDIFLAIGDEEQLKLMRELVK